VVVVEGTPVTGDGFTPFFPSHVPPVSKPRSS